MDCLFVLVDAACATRLARFIRTVLHLSLISDSAHSSSPFQGSEISTNQVARNAIAYYVLVLSAKTPTPCFNTTVKGTIRILVRQLGMLTKLVPISALLVLSNVLPTSVLIKSMARRTSSTTGQATKLQLQGQDVTRHGKSKDAHALLTLLLQISSVRQTAHLL